MCGNGSNGIETSSLRHRLALAREKRALQRRPIVSLRQLGFYAFHVVIHAGEVRRGSRRAFGDPNLAALVLDRAGEGMEVTAFDADDDLFSFAFHVGGYQIADRQLDGVVVQAAPEILWLPSAIHNRLGGLDVIRAQLLTMEVSTAFGPKWAMSEA